MRNWPGQVRAPRITRPGSQCVRSEEPHGCTGRRPTPRRPGADGPRDRERNPSQQQPGHHDCLGRPAGQPHHRIRGDLHRKGLPPSPSNAPNPIVAITVPALDAEDRKGTVENCSVPEDALPHKTELDIGHTRSRMHFFPFISTTAKIAGVLLGQARAGVVAQGVMETRDAEWVYRGAFQFWGNLATIHEIECPAFASGSYSGHATGGLRTF